MASINITSLALHYEELLHHDVILVQESRLTTFGQHYMQMLLEEKGWTAIWGISRPPQQGTVTEESISGKCGGVAILYRTSLQFQPAPDFLLESYPLLRTHRFSTEYYLQNTDPLYIL